MISNHSFRNKDFGNSKFILQYISSIQYLLLHLAMELLRYEESSVSLSGSNVKPQVPWRNPNCGGCLVNGTSNCTFDDEGALVCLCLVKPKNFNYLVHYQLMQEVFVQKLHTSKSTNGTVAGWETLALKMFAVGPFRPYSPVSSYFISIKLFCV